MPGPAIFFALLRGALIASGRAAVAGSRIAATKLASGARLMSRLGMRFAESSLRVAKRLATNVFKGSKILAMKAWQALKRGAMLIRKVVARVVSRIISIINRLRTQVERASTQYISQIKRNLANSMMRIFNDASLESNREFAEAIDDYLNNPTYDKSERFLKLNALRSALLAKYTNLVEWTLNNSNLSDDEIIRRLLREVEPEVVAARILATGDPTAGLDVDVGAHLERIAAGFIEFIRQIHAGNERINRIRIVQFLIDETMRGARAASFRQLLIDQLSRDKIAINIDNAVIGAVSAQRSHDIQLMPEQELLRIRAIGELVVGEEGPGSVVNRNARIAQAMAIIGELATRAGLIALNEYLYAALRMQKITAFEYLGLIRHVKFNLSRLENPQEEMEEAEKPIKPTPIHETEPESPEIAESEVLPPALLHISDPIEDEDEDESEALVDEPEEDVIYGIWVLNARRMTRYHCSDCEALAALTSFAPVPIHTLPQPGTETACGDLCGCDIEEVSADEQGKSYMSWNAIFKDAFGFDLPSKFDDIPKQILPTFFHMIYEDYDFMEKWARKLGILQ
jgi:hypothetical protein